MAKTKLDLIQFEGTPPYASERFGVYQPLMGWKSVRKLRWVFEQVQLAHQTYLYNALRDPTIAQMLEPYAQPLSADTLALEAVTRELEAREASHNDELIDAFNARLHERDLARPVHTIEDGAYSLSTALGDAQVRRVGEWRGVGVYRSATKVSNRALESVGATRLLGSRRTFLVRSPQTSASRLTTSESHAWLDAKSFINPFHTFNQKIDEAFLSPVGLVQLFRQYFFELESFLGPSVGSAWVSPGGTVELYEMATRRSRLERTTETTIESLVRSERSLTEQDELSDSVSEQNQNNTTFGISASGGFNFAVAQGSASANLDIAQATTDAKTVTHRHQREQSEKLTQELRRSFKTVFREVREFEDVSSRRHVLSNTTSALMNYELRRKMRRVAVQVQHVGAQLCWQVFIDNPGHGLGLSQLIHIAKPGDTSEPPPPEAPPSLDPKSTTLTVQFPFQPKRGNAGSEQYTNGVKDSNEIAWQRDFAAAPPGHGYKLETVTLVSVVGSDPGKWQPHVAPTLSKTNDQTFRIQLDYVDFNDNPALVFTVTIVWSPPDQSGALASYTTEQEKWKEAERRRAHQAYVTAMQERVNQAAAIRARPARDLRDEERTIVFRRLIGQLTQLSRPETEHTISELVRGMFDVDSMLYFVAPEWWRPRNHAENITAPWGPVTVESETPPAKESFIEIFGIRIPIPQPKPPNPPVPVTQLSDDDLVGWGGPDDKHRPNYAITAESDSARMGASLGWLLQLDGDNHRNAFLNAPWVKAIIPIRPGHEERALDWLKQSAVEGSEGLDDPYLGDASEAPAGGPTLEEALLNLAQQVTNISTDPKSLTATETVYETGFATLEGGFRASGNQFDVYDQWIEVVPTDEVVAVPYDIRGAILDPPSPAPPNWIQRLVRWLQGRT